MRSRMTPAALHAAPPVPQPQPAEAEATAPAVPAPVASEAPEAIPALSPAPSAAIDVHEAPQYEDEAEKPTAPQAADESKNESASVAPEQSEKPADEQKPVKAEVRQQPKSTSPSTMPVGAIIMAFFVMSALAAITVMVYLQS